MEASLILARPELVARLSPPDGRAPKVATIIAPSGYGKTTFLDALRGPEGIPNSVFLSLAECEDHVGLCVDLLTEAVRETFPGADVAPLYGLKQSVASHEVPQRLPFVLARVIERATARPTTLLIDDLQQLRPGAPLTELVGALLRADVSQLRFVLASSQAIPFDLSSFRAAGQIVELTSRELEFGVGEVRDFLTQQLGRAVDPRLAEHVWERTHGWPGVLGLLGVLVRDRSDEALEALADETAAGDDAVLELVVLRLLEAHRSEVQYFARVVSILERVEPAVAEALFVRRSGGRALGEGDGHLIELPARELPGYIAELEAAQVLVADPRAGGLAFNPLVGATLRRILAREHPLAFREAHRRAAAWLLEAVDPLPPSALDHLVAAEDHDALLDVLEGEAQRFFESGYHRHLTHWLRKLEAHYASLPFWASYYLGRVYAMLGEWDRARGYLDRCKAGLGERDRAGDLWRWHPRVALGYAGMYWRRGMHSDASTYCRRGLDFLRQLERRGRVPQEHRVEAVGLQLGLLNLLGTLKLEAGSWDKAWAVFQESRDLAAAEGLASHEAEALKNLGLIATRRGAITDGTRLYDEALALVDRSRDLERYATVASDLGMNRLITGDYAGARELLEEALAIRLDTGHPASIAETLTALGRLLAAAGEPGPADDAFRRAVRMLDNIGNLKTRSEVLDRYAAFLASHGRLYEAQTMHDRAEALIGGLLRPEAPLTALHRETATELALAKGRMDEALGHLTTAVERYEKLEARYFVARLYWRAAAIHHRLFVEERRTTPESVVSYLELACAEANRQGYLFGPLEDQRELLLVGFSLGHPETVRYCARALERLDGQAPDEDAVVRLPEPAATRYNKFQQRLDRDDEFVVLTRDGRGGAPENQVDELVRSRGARSLVVLLHDQEMVNHGERVSLSQKRVILPLLVHFLRHPDSDFSMAELASHVWDSDDLSESMKTKVKVAISRLRSLLGKDRPYVVTSRRSEPDGSSIVTYGLNPDLEFYLVQRSVPA